MVQIIGTCNSLFAQTSLWLGVWPFSTNERRVAKSDLFLWGQWRMVCLRKLEIGLKSVPADGIIYWGPRDIRPRQPRSNSEINKNHGSGIYVYWHHAMAIVRVNYLLHKLHCISRSVSDINICLASRLPFYIKFPSVYGMFLFSKSNYPEDRLDLTMWDAIKPQ